MIHTRFPTYKWRYIKQHDKWYKIFPYEVGWTATGHSYHRLKMSGTLLTECTNRPIFETGHSFTTNKLPCTFCFPAFRWPYYRDMVKSKVYFVGQFD